MIGFISGKTIHKDHERLVIQTGTIGYEVFVSANLLNKARVGEAIELFTHLYVREDILALYGFTDVARLEIFRHLISVSGVGPKIALGVLSVTNVAKIKKAVAEAQPEVFAAVSGIGKKTAGRIILDLQSKLGSAKELDFRGEPRKEEAVAALMNLGYKKAEAAEALKDVDGQLPPEVQLKQALKNFAA